MAERASGAGRPEKSADEPSVPLDAAIRVAKSFATKNDGLAGADDDFFRIARDSFLATGLMADIEQAFGGVLPISTLLKAAAGRASAPFFGGAARQGPAKCLVAVRDIGEGPVLFCVHGLNGDVLASLALAVALGPSRPLKAFRAAGLKDGEIPLASVPEIASDYLSEVAAAQPRGPYVVMGHCAGSLIAYEMAQQLRMRNLPVAGLIMIDPAAWNDSPGITRRGLDKHIRAARYGKLAERKVAEAFRDPSLGGDKRRKLVEMSLFGALGAYLPDPYPDSALLICTPRTEPHLLHPQIGFPGLAPRLETVVIDTDHRSLFLSRVKDVAAAINRYLDRVAPVGAG